MESYENFPAWIVLLSTSVAVSIYGLGAYILAGFGIWVAALYLLYCLWAEFEVLKGSCVDCYYYGKVCGLGKGKLAPLFFKKGDPKKFAEKEFTWYKMLPDFLVFIFPIVGGIILLVRSFSWLLVVLLAILIALSFGGNAVIRGQFACKYCKQREISCPAAKAFGGKTAGK
ncbi:MAG: hypothetical protein QMD08_03240 [Actinomycetota bacterium]|nr:hypothetical protein [Actinomycetota bacterium]